MVAVLEKAELKTIHWVILIPSVRSFTAYNFTQFVQESLQAKSNSLRLHTTIISARLTLFIKRGEGGCK